LRFIVDDSVDDDGDDDDDAGTGTSKEKMALAEAHKEGDAKKIQAATKALKGKEAEMSEKKAKSGKYGSLARRGLESEYESIQRERASRRGGSRRARPVSLGVLGIF
jgi:hypothetical protein